MLIIALLTAVAVVPSPLPGEPEPDGVVATAPATPLVLDGAADPVAAAVEGAPQAVQPHGLSTDEQIARWLAARSADTARPDESPIWRDDRQIHGEFTVGFGTGGYRDYGAAVSLPLGESGRLDLSVRQVENGYPYGYRYGTGYEPWFDDNGYVFPGASQPGAAWEYERRLSRPDGPPDRRPQVHLQQAAEE